MQQANSNERRIEHRQGEAPCSKPVENTGRETTIRWIVQRIHRNNSLKIRAILLDTLLQHSRCLSCD